MKRVLFVKGLITEEVSFCEHVEYYEQRFPYPALPTSDGMLLCNETVDIHRSPVHHIRRLTGDRFNDYKDVYIAFSEEVQEGLCMPFDAIVREPDMLARKEAKRINNVLKAMSIFDKIKFLWDGKIKDLEANHET